MPTVRSIQGDTLDGLCWRELGATRGVLEDVFELNRGLAELGPVLPPGTAVTLPDPASVQTPQTQTVQLWD